MVNKPRAQGTRAESRFTRLMQTAGLLVRRLAEGGSLDEGDHEVRSRAGERYVVEVRDRERMNAARALEAAVGKSKTFRTILWWSQPVPGGLRRRRRRCICTTEEAMIELLGGDQAATATRGPRPSRIWSDEPLPLEGLDP